MGTLLKNATIVNEGKSFKGHVLIENELISNVYQSTDDISSLENDNNVIDLNGKYLLPGVIDDQVHFREPGLTHKATIKTESRAAVAGGITSFMEMPNTVPNALTQELLNDKYDIGAKDSYANYSFYMGVSNDNIEEVLKTDPKTVCGVKVFMGSSTGNMLVDNRETLEELFAKCKLLIAAHCEDETTILNNTAIYKEKYGEDVPMECHPEIRSEEACYLSSSMAIELAKKHNTRFHLFHLSTAKEIGLLDNTIPLKEKRITAEACIHHMWFSDKDYAEKGSLIKWNPAVKTENDRDQILQAVIDDKIDVIATDHAPHTIEEKQNKYFNAPSGGPLVQHALVAMLEHVHNGKITLEKMVEKMSHAVADCFNIDSRGFIRKGYYADLVVVDLDSPWEVKKENLFYKCGWSPFEGTTFRSKVLQTYINGSLVYNNGTFDENFRGKRMLFNN
ncbi:dihydroorotase [Vicingus serpentipes]|uniref:Dihydroorotase n=1 Tax=Vicingus serpentipes TaxID=1926625 RepID=A0A5C6RQ86_9FLAO|nr:dihydroorotase [Vicingus serpentipes]TXB64556.1 dihydroorotase [Vicingus serpentipes]